jgi:hypothetical protein
MNVRVCGADAASNNTFGASLVVATPAQLFGVHVFSKEATNTRYLMIFDAASAYANGNAPLVCIPVTAKSQVTTTWPDGRPFTAGICLMWSTTEPLLTVDTNATPTGHFDV